MCQNLVNLQPITHNAQLNRIYVTHSTNPPKPSAYNSQLATEQDLCYAFNLSAQTFHLQPNKESTLRIKPKPYLCHMQREFTDQLGRTVTLNYPPKRIISVVPSQTELLFDLGLDEEVVGITKFCVHPIEKFVTRAKVGGTKKLLIEKIRDLKPDLIIGNKEENTQEEIELLMEEFPVWMSDISNLEEAMQAIGQIAALVDRQPEAAYLNHLINAGFTDLQTLARSKKIDQRVAYLIWKDPYMVAGQRTFIADILRKIGLQNVIKAQRYPTIELSDPDLLNCQLVLLSSEPYPFKQKHIDEIKAILPNTKVVLVDGEMFSWYGSRLVKAVEYLFHLQDELIS